MCNICYDDDIADEHVYQSPCCSFIICKWCIDDLVDVIMTHRRNCTIPYRGVNLRKLDQRFKWFVCPQCQAAFPLLIDAFNEHAVTYTPDITDNLGYRFMATCALRIMKGVEKNKVIEVPTDEKLNKWMSQVFKKYDHPKPVYNAFKPYPNPPRWFIPNQTITVIPYANLDRITMRCRGCDVQSAPKHKILRTWLDNDGEEHEIPTAFICDGCINQYETAIHPTESMRIFVKMAEYRKQYEEYKRAKSEIFSERTLAKDITIEMGRHIAEWLHKWSDKNKEKEHRSDIDNLIKFHKGLSDPPLPAIEDNA